MPDPIKNKDGATPKHFISKINVDWKREDAEKFCAMMERLSGSPPLMWNPAMIGFGSYHYKYEGGLEGDWFITGFSLRKSNFSIYIMAGFRRYEEILAKLGKHKTGSSCLCIKKLSDIDFAILEELIAESEHYMKEKYGIET